MSIPGEERVDVETYDLEQALVGAAVCGGRALLRQANKLLPGRLAVVSSFGAESAVLLALAAEVNPDLPVIFLQTGMHFDETLAYREELSTTLQLTNVIDVQPGAAETRLADPGEVLWQFDPDACCRVRKVLPMQRALAPYECWASGRKRHQSQARRELPWVERSGRQWKINPLADWTRQQIEAEIVRRGLPRHPLVAEGYASIGCGPCTSRVAPGQDPRSGRWAGTMKLECGIHQPAAIA